MTGGREGEQTNKSDLEGGVVQQRPSHVRGEPIDKTAHRQAVGTLHLVDLKIEELVERHVHGVQCVLLPVGVPRAGAVRDGHLL